MKVQHGKDLANHSGPESWGGAHEGAAEALAGETGGSAIEPRNQNSGTPTQLSDAEGNMRQGDRCESWGSPARSETLHTPGMRLKGTPQTLLIDKEGRVLKNWQGAYIGLNHADIQKYFQVRLPECPNSRHE
jgi:hypothetical protein